MPDIQLPSNYRVSIKALITNAAGELLMVKEGAEHWDLPGGGLDHGETIEHALTRELSEELDIKLINFTQAPVFVWTFRSENPERGHLLWLVYAAKVEGEAKVTSHITALKYHNLESLKPSDVADYFQPAFDDLVKYRPSLV